MKPWNEITHYAGFDWARDHHDVVIVDRSGEIIADFEIQHSAGGWQRWREQVAALGPGVAVCVETSQGMVIEQLLESRVSVYPISPVSSKAYRVRKVPTGSKTDRLDAWSLADACVSMARTGKRSPRRIRWWPSCVCFAATKWP